MEKEGNVNSIRPAHQSSSVQHTHTAPRHDKGPQKIYDYITCTSDITSSDEPLDMSLKRAHPSTQDDPPPPVKKLRLSPTEQENRTPFRPVLVNPKRHSTTTSTLIISPDCSLEGINTHFRRSLCKYVVDTERNVEEHFVRSLGKEVWDKLLQSKTKKTNTIRREATRQKRSISKTAKSNSIS